MFLHLRFNNVFLLSSKSLELLVVLKTPQTQVPYLHAITDCVTNGLYFYHACEKRWIQTTDNSAAPTLDGRGASCNPNPPTSTSLTSKAWLAEDRHIISGSRIWGILCGLEQYDTHTMDCKKRHDRWPGRIERVPDRNICEPTVPHDLIRWYQTSKKSINYITMLLYYTALPASDVITQTYPPLPSTILFVILY